MSNNGNIVSKIGAYIASFLLVSLVVLILVEIVGRSFFDYSTMIADEYSGYLYLALVFLGLGFTFDDGKHIRISLLTSHLNQKGKRVADIVAGFTITAILLFILYRAWLLLADTHEMEMVSENVSETPLYLTQIPMVVGILLFIISTSLYFFKRIKDDS